MYTQYIFIHTHRPIIYLYPERDRDHIPFKRMKLIYMIMHTYIFIHTHRHIIYLYPEKDTDHIQVKRMELIYVIIVV